MTITNFIYFYTYYGNGICVPIVGCETLFPSEFILFYNYLFVVCEMKRCLHRFIFTLLSNIPPIFNLNQFLLLLVLKLISKISN